MSKLRKTSVDLFTPDEHAILAEWLSVEPPSCAKDISDFAALERLGFTREPNHYDILDAAAAYIVIERVEDRLPQWASFSQKTGVQLARQYRDSSKVPNRKVLLQPKRLLTINWGDSGPGFSWPVAYYVTWLPFYDCFVVTASADCPDAFGYCDLALGSFGIKTPIKKGAKEIICGDWANQHAGWDQQRWSYLFDTGLISEEEADAWGDDVWGSEASEEDWDDEQVG